MRSVLRPIMDRRVPGSRVLGPLSLVQRTMNL